MGNVRLRFLFCIAALTAASSIYGADMTGNSQEISATVDSVVVKKPHGNPPKGTGFYLKMGYSTILTKANSSYSDRAHINGTEWQLGIDYMFKRWIGVGLMYSWSYFSYDSPDCGRISPYGIYLFPQIVFKQYVPDSKFFFEERVGYGLALYKESSDGDKVGLGGGAVFVGASALYKLSKMLYVGLDVSYVQGLNAERVSWGAFEGRNVCLGVLSCGVSLHLYF